MIIDPLIPEQEDGEQLAPHVAAERLARELAGAVAWNFWPRLIRTPSGDPSLEVKVRHDGKPISVPDLVNSPPLDLFVKAFRELKTRPRRGSRSYPMSSLRSSGDVVARPAHMCLERSRSRRVDTWLRTIGRSALQPTSKDQATTSHSCETSSSWWSTERSRTTFHLTPPFNGRPPTSRARARARRSQHPSPLSTTSGRRRTSARGTSRIQGSGDHGRPPCERCVMRSRHAVQSRWGMLGPPPQPASPSVLNRFALAAEFLVAGLPGTRPPGEEPEPRSAPENTSRPGSNPNRCSRARS